VKAVPGREVRIPDGAVVGEGNGCEWVIGFWSDEPLLEGAAKTAVARMLAAREGCSLGAPELSGVEVRVVGVRR